MSGRAVRSAKRLVREAQQRQQAPVAAPEAQPAPPIPDVARRVREALADFDEPLTPWQNEVMDLLHVALERGGPDALTPEFARQARDVVHVALYGRPAPRC